MNWNSLLDHLENWLRERRLLDADQRWVVGVSGGPDSTLLLHAMHALSETRGLNLSLCAAHFHHGLRGADADADAEFAAQCADQLNVAFHREDGKLAAQLERGGASTEELARDERYAFLERIALRTGSDLVAVGHHADDNTETVLQRICRGTGLRGLAGMRDIRELQPGSRVRLVRPFLPLRRTDLLEICAQQQIAFRHDPSNESSEFTRNRIRHEILPMLREKINRNVDDALLRLAEQARWLGTYLEDTAERALDSMLVAQESGLVALSISELLKKHRIIQAGALRRAVFVLLGEEIDLGFHHIESLLKLAADATSGKEVHLPGPIVARKQYDRLELRPLSRNEQTVELTPVVINIPGSTLLPDISVELHAELRDVAADEIAALCRQDDPREEWIDYDQIRPPLVVRGRQNGDRFWPLGAPGSKRISDFLIGEKVESEKRARTGVLCDQDGPVWVMPLRIDERVKLRGSTRRALHLKILSTNREPPPPGAA